MNFQKLNDKITPNILRLCNDAQFQPAINTSERL